MARQGSVVEMVANNGQLDAENRQDKEYGACGHGDIVDWDGFSGVIERVQAIGDLGAIRKGLHDGGHLKVASPQIGEKAADGTDQLHRGLEGVFDKVVTDATGQSGTGLTADDGGLAALQLRLTSIALMESQGQLPDLERMKAIWTKIAAHPDEKLVAETLANLMHVFQRADNATSPNGTFPLTQQFEKLVNDNPLTQDQLTREGPSQVREWFVKRLLGGYRNMAMGYYTRMLEHGSAAEVDVALNSLDMFRKHQQAGGSHREKLAPVYAQAVESLLAGANQHCNGSVLDQKARYGEAQSLRDKALAFKAEFFKPGVS